ncbi:dihydrofolate reductase family protein [Pseudonocardia sp. C8]|nr:dihydrofolate reductase family protein [Pseudonocardia sp. C8]MBC3192212.1 dihydrofolate reductase family protein [Pseudonocardia sp. C8]
MRKVIANEFVTLDGVVQAPSYADEDLAGGFEHGGWNARYLDDVSMQWVIDNVRGAGGYLLGRGTYQRFAAHWPHAPEEQQVLAEPMNTLPKYVASTTIEEPLRWQNARLLAGDLGAAVAALKADDGGDLHLIGSPGLLQTLIHLGLVDELRLMIDPVVVGGGKRLFGDDGALQPLRLVDSRVTGTGAIIATYATGGG